MFTIEVLNVNEPPIKIAITDETGQLSFLDDRPRVQENSSKGTVVGTAIAYDSDEKELLSFRLDGDANGRFALGPVTCKAVTDVPVSRNDFLNNFLSFFFSRRRRNVRQRFLLAAFSTTRPNPSITSRFVQRIPKDYSSLVVSALPSSTSTNLLKVLLLSADPSTRILTTRSWQVSRRQIAIRQTNTLTR